MRLAFVVPRYGAEIVGGAEKLVRDYAEHLQKSGHDVRVLTTCAKDHTTWQNAFPEGDSLVNDVGISRFPISDSSNLGKLWELEGFLQMAGTLPEEDQEDWIHNLAYSEGLLAEIERVSSEVDAIIFAPYLFSTTVLGARVCPEKSIIIPCLHDEVYARLPIVQETLKNAAGLIFNTPEEEELARGLMESLPPSVVVGMGFREIDTPAFAQPGTSNYVAYAGRREEGKGWGLLANWVWGYSHFSSDGPVELLAMGGGALNLPFEERKLVRDLGFVNEAKKHEVMAQAIAVAQLSTMESFSYVLMESWLVGTPVIVNSACAVTRGHCTRSNGGLWVGSGEEFVEAVERLRFEPGLRESLGKQGRDYVLREYNWDTVSVRLTSAIARFVS